MRFRIQQGPFAKPSRGKYPFREIEPGQAFFVACKRPQRRKKQQALAAACMRWRRLGLGVFATTVYENGVLVERFD